MELDFRKLALPSIFVVSLAIYVLTLCPTVYNGDSGDFITASYTLGIAHPPGYPFYVLFGKLFSLLPLGSVAYRYNLLSALFASAAAYIVGVISYRFTKSFSASVCAGLMLAFSVSMWDQATVAEAYGLNGLFISILVYLALDVKGKDATKKLALFLAVFGLSLTNHLSVILYLPAFAYLILKDNKGLLRGISAVKYFSYFLLPLSLYLYIPLRALANPVYNWGRPDNIGRFISHVSGAVHRQTTILGIPAEGIFERFFSLSYSLFRQFSFASVLVLFGFYRGGSKNRGFLNFTLVFVLSDFIYSLFLNDVSLSITPFMIPSLVLFSVWGAIGFTYTIPNLGKMAKDPRIVWAISIVFILIVISSNYYISDKSGNLIAFDFGMNVLKTVDEGAIIFARGDNVVFPLYYLTYVEGIRPDVKIIEDTGLLSHDVYGVDYVGLGLQEHQIRQKQAEEKIIKDHSPVYYTYHPIFEFNGFEVIQQGLVYRVIPEGDRLDRVNYWERYDFRQVWDTTIHMDYMSQLIRAKYFVMFAQEHLLSDADRATFLLEEARKILPDDVDIMFDLGNVMLSQGRYDDAIVTFREVLKKDPLHERAANNLGYAYAAKGERTLAKRFHTEALRINPLYSSARFNLAGILMLEGDYASAINHLQQVLSSDPKYSKAYFSLGHAYSNLKQYERSNEALQRFIELNPASPARSQVELLIRENKRLIENMSVAKQVD